MPRYALLTACALPILVLVSLFILRANDRQSEKVLEAPSIEDAAGSERAQSQLASAERLPIEPQASIGSFLREYWGADWSNVEKQYSERQVNLDAPNQLKAWVDIKEEVQKIGRSYYERERAFMGRTFLGGLDETNEKLLGQLGMTDVNRDEVLFGLNIELSATNAELEALCGRYLFELDSAMGHVFAQEPDKYPLADLRSQESHGRGSLEIQVESEGWYVSYRCNYKDYPVLEDIDKEREQLIGKKLGQVKDLIRRSQN